MSAAMSMSRGLLPLPPRSLSSRIDEQVRGGEKQGIVTVLGYDPGTARASPLRRTLSADMSSREWLAMNGFHPSKKTESSDDEEETLRKDVEGCGGQVYLWKPMKEERREDEKPEKRGETWGSILFQKVGDSKSLPPPYVHPMVKRSKSCLSTKSLEVCTESLGSETGSDGFSASEGEDGEAEEGHEQTRATAFDVGELYHVTTTTISRKTRPRMFPPPIQSLSQGGGSVSMQSRRDNGRLVLEAVSVPTERNFEARREEGRLVLTFANSDDEDVDEEEEEEEEMVIELDEEDISMEEDETEENDDEGGPMNVHNLAKMPTKPITRINRNPGWQGEYVGAFDAAEEDTILLEQLLPLKPPMAWMLPTPQSVPSTAMAMAAPTPTSLNTYEYFWRNKTPTNPSIASSIGMKGGHGLNISVYAKNLPSDDAPKHRPLTREGYPSPLLQSCYNPSRTNLLWGPKCIATS